MGGAASAPAGAVDGQAGAAGGRAGERAAAGIFSCVVDTGPRFHLDVMRWYAALTRLAGVTPADLLVHAVRPAGSEALDLLRERGVTVREVEPFDAASPHCNKIAGALSLAELGERSGVFVLTDADVAVCEDPRRLEMPAGHVGMTPVHMGNPPLAVLEGVFAAAGVAAPRRVDIQWQPGESTLAGNGNGGLYLVPGALLPAVAHGWAEWARWLLARRELLAEWALHVDQVAMALALAAAGIPTWELDIRWNLPTHVAAILPASPPVPAVVHYHQHVDAAGRLAPTGREAIDLRVAAANTALDELWRERFPNALFWEWRYLSNPALGSGTGSRGSALAEKRALLEALIEVLAPASTLDIGCGDGQATVGLELPGYVGLDLSAAALEQAHAGRPEGDHRVGTLGAPGADEHEVRPANLTLCLDVLLHQAEPAAYHGLVQRLIEVTARALLVSGYELPFRPAWPTVHFHEPLSETLARAAPAAEIHRVRDEGEISTFLVLQPARPASAAGRIGQAPAAQAGTAPPGELVPALFRLLAARARRIRVLAEREAAALAELERARHEAARLAAECRTRDEALQGTAAELGRFRHRLAALEGTRAFRLRSWLLRQWREWRRRPA